MFYFKTCKIDFPDNRIIEDAIRESTSKRHSPLDLLSSTTNIKHAKLFIGRETETSISITRIRTYIAGMMPKIIVSFDKENKVFNKYKVRLSFISTCILSAIVLSLIVFPVYSLLVYDFTFNPSGLLFLLLLYISLVFLELQLTQDKIILIIKNQIVREKRNKGDQEKQN